MSARSHKRVVRLEVVRLYGEMAKLTAPECGSSGVCTRGRGDGYRCCSGYYCQVAIKHAKKKWGEVELQPTGHPELPLMGPDGCTAAPHLRPICTVHTCEINEVGKKTGDPEWTARYFRIRDRLSDLDSTISLEDL